MNHTIFPNLSERLHLKSSNKCVALHDLSIYFTWKNIRQHYKNKLKTIVPTWNDEFKLPDGFYSVSDIQDYTEHIIKKHEALPTNPNIYIYINMINNRLVFKIKHGYKLELQTLET